MNILLIAPVPPPVTGQSLAVKVFHDELIKKHNVDIVNLRKDSFKNGVNSYRRIIEILMILKNSWVKRKQADLIYFTISESIAGNIKDILIYLICFKKLNKTIVHMLGGAGMKRILERKGILYRINKFFLSRVKAVVTEGQAQAVTFSKHIPKANVHIVPNFAEDFLFVDEKEVKAKFSKVSPLKILFLSNMLYGKGYDELADAYIRLDDDIKANVVITFVGGFESENNKNEFMTKIADHDNLIYRGKYIGGEEKKALYYESHIFCLPSYYPYEGQPISILEAYATGCVVIATAHSGIPNVFCDKLNGFMVEKRSPDSIKTVIEKIMNKDNEYIRLSDIGMENRNTAYSKYRTSIYISSLLTIAEAD